MSYWCFSYMASVASPISSSSPATKPSRSESKPSSISSSASLSMFFSTSSFSSSSEPRPASSSKNAFLSLFFFFYNFFALTVALAFIDSSLAFLEGFKDLADYSELEFYDDSMVLLPLLGTSSLVLEGNEDEIASDGTTSLSSSESFCSSLSSTELVLCD